MNNIINNKEAVTLLQKHFDSALETPDGVKKLRELILTLAMQGKLLEQNPEDTPVVELLKEIKAVKEQLLKAGEIKKPETLLEIRKDEMPFDIPISWEWVRLSQVTKIITKGSSPNWQGVNYTSEDNGILFITSENVDNYKLKLVNKKYVEKHFNDIEPRSILEKYDLLMNIVGASIGRVGYYSLDEVANINQAVCLIRLAKMDCPFDFNFILHFLNSKTCISYMYDKQVDNARPNLSMSNISRFLIPLPPLAEQKRIVAKIDQLMTLCDKLESERNERNNKRLKIHAAAINKLLTAPDNSEFNSSWDFITKNFNELYSVKENVEELKKAILQLAVMGKLVPQDPKDQPASELLKEIEAEKKKLAKAGKIKKQESLPPIKPTEMPYIVPQGWEWAHLSALSSKIHYGYTASANYNLTDVRLLRITDIQDNKVDWLAVPGCAIKEKEIEQYKLSVNDILIARTGGTVGKSFLVQNVDVKAVFASYLIRVIPSSLISVRYLKYYLECPLYWKQMYAKCSGTGQPNVNGTSLSSLFVPLPPIAEQKRIVAKIDQLMSLCITLVQQVNSSTDKQTAILDAVLAKI